MSRYYPGPRPAPRCISAMQVIHGEDGNSRIELMTQVDAANDFEICGPGFNDTTIKVRCGESFYYVFREDVPQKGRNYDFVSATA